MPSSVSNRTISTDLLVSKKRRLLELLKIQKKRRGINDLWFFNKHILNYSDLTSKNQFHGELCDLVDNDARKNLLILEPRGSLKTSCITVGYVLQQIVKNPNIRVLICSEEFNTAKKFLSEIKGHIENNETFKSLYGNLKSRHKWSENEITVSTRKLWRKEPTITCAGIDVTKVGLHYDLIIIDDPHSSKNITTREQIEKVKTWYKLVLSLLDPGKKIIVIGTRWHYDDLFGWLIERERIRRSIGKPKRYHIKREQAIRKDGTLLWPERLSLEFLEDQKLEQGPYIFSCQYQNEPVDDDSAVFKRSWLKYYHEKELPKGLRTFTTVDPMIDEDGNDYTAIVTCSLSHDWKAYIRDIRRAKMDEHELVNQLFDVYEKFRPDKIGIETVAWQKLLYRFVKAEMARRGKRLPITPLVTDSRTTKRMRIRSMVPYWKAGLFLIPEQRDDEDNIGIFIDELTRYPRVSNDDTIDALAYMDQLLRRPMISKIVKKVPKNSVKSLLAEMKRLNRSDRLGVQNLKRRGKNG